MSTREPLLQSIHLDETSHSRSTSATSTNDDQEDLTTLVLRLMIAILLPMWIAMVLSSLFFVTLRQLLGVPIHHDSQFISRDLNIQIEPLGSNVGQILAVPALFGPVLTQSEITPIVWLNSTGCERVDYTPPELEPDQWRMLPEQPGWTAMVVRGGCSFDEKVFRMEQAGFSHVIVYNYETGDDIPVRMSSHVKVDALT